MNVFIVHNDIILTVTDHNPTNNDNTAPYLATLYDKCTHETYECFLHSMTEILKFIDTWIDKAGK